MADAGVFDSDRRRMELVGGHLYEMPPIGTPHLIVVTRLQRLFERAIDEDLRVLVQQPLIVDQFDEPQPDLVHPAPPTRKSETEVTGLPCCHRGV